MKTNCIIILLTLLISQNFFGQQFNSTKLVYTGKIDSVVVSTFQQYNKETSSIFDTIEDYSKRNLKKKILTKSEITRLNEILKNKNSYNKRVPLLNDGNINIEYYLNNQIIQIITFSSLTKKISIKNEICDDKKNQITSNNCLFYSSASKKFEVFILKLIPK